MESQSSLIDVFSIGSCARLVLLDMSDCNKIIKLPSSIGNLKKVWILSVSGCIGVDEFPIEMKDMELLKVLKVERIPKFVLHSLPPSLVILSLKDNNLTSESFPVDLSSMIMLKRLYLDKNPIDSLPTFVRSLSKLEVLSVKGCSMLKSVGCPPSSMIHLSIEDCLSLMELTFHEEMSGQPSVKYRGAESLNEIPGIIKFQDLAQVEEKILSALGWTNLQSVKDQEKFNIWAPNMWFHKKKPVQMYYEFGIFSTCFIGKEVPDWLGGYKSNGPSISFVIPSTPVNKRFQGLNIALVDALRDKRGGNILSKKIVNKTKNMTWVYYCPLSVYEEVDDSEMVVWLSHWMFGENEFEDGDEVTPQIIDIIIDVKEYAISPVYGDISSDNEEDPLAYFKSYKYRVGEDLSSYQVAPGYYILLKTW